jgi:hypothetical protein
VSDAWRIPGTAWRSLPTGGLALLIAAALGCGAGQPGLVQVHGRIDATVAEPATVAGHIVEIEQVEDAGVRGFAAIDGEGRFSFRSLQGGTVRDGVVPGAYRGRLVLVADDEPTLEAVRKRVPERYLGFASSGIAFEVPLDGELVIRTERR